jgi:hypothetical protein
MLHNRQFTVVVLSFLREVVGYFSVVDSVHGESEEACLLLYFLLTLTHEALIIITKKHQMSAELTNIGVQLSQGTVTVDTRGRIIEAVRTLLAESFKTQELLEEKGQPSGPLEALQNSLYERISAAAQAVVVSREQQSEFDLLFKECFRRHSGEGLPEMERSTGSNTRFKRSSSFSGFMDEVVSDKQKGKYEEDESLNEIILRIQER